MMTAVDITHLFCEYLSFSRGSCLFLLLPEKNQQYGIQTQVGIGRLILFSLSISGPQEKSHDLVEQGTLFLLYRECISRQKDLQDKANLNSSHYLVLHVNAC